MIFYFSATGNTKWIAETAAAEFGDKAVEIRAADPESYTFGPDDMLGICFPVYDYHTPLNVQDFARKLKPNGAYTYVICDYSNCTGHCLQDFDKNVLPIDAGFGLLMPDNTSSIGKHFDTEESGIEKLKTAPERLSKILSRIKSREKGVMDSYEGPDPDSTDFDVHGYFEKCFTEPFHVKEDVCIGCGLCSENCPVGAIEMKDGHPVWVPKTCYYCSACINNCPVEAIEFDDVSQGVYRYTLEKYKKYLGG
jgi:ferredoxin